MPDFAFTSSDSTSIHGWRNDGTGPAVVISNGLGSVPGMWPGLLSPDNDLRTATWYYRGTGNSERPADRSRITIADHTDDLIALMDHEGIDRAIVAGWSVGVNIAFEAARLHPDRVAGLLAVAGVPGGTFDALFGPIPVPRRLRHPLGYGAATMCKWAGGGINALLHSMPMNPVTTAVIRRTGLMRATTDPAHLVPALDEFRLHDFRWYFTLAQAAAKHEAMDLSFVECPVTIVAGKSDLITSMRDIVTAAGQIAHAEISVVPGTHFLPLERPADLVRLTHELIARTDLVPAS